MNVSVVGVKRNLQMYQLLNQKFSVYTKDIEEGEGPGRKQGENQEDQEQEKTRTRVKTNRG